VSITYVSIIAAIAVDAWRRTVLRGCMDATGWVRYDV
jgi:hypothetical protein